MAAHLVEHAHGLTEVGVAQVGHYEGLKTRQGPMDTEP